MTLDKLPIRVGDHYPDWPAQVDAAAQQESLFCCGIDPSLYAGFADITAFATQTILASKSLGHSINGMVHVRQEFSLHRPIELGAAITGSGIVESIEETDRGQLITTTFEFRTPDDEVPLRTKKASLRVDPSRRPNRTKSNTPVTAQLEHPTDVWQLEPEKVARYSQEGENLIHSDPEVARKFGFRAPIAGGLMAVRRLMGVIARHGLVERMELAVQFKRPMFWDEKLRLFAKQSFHQRNNQVVIVRPDNRPAVEADINDLSLRRLRG